MNIEDLKQHIRDVPDFPKPGIIFKDITPLLANAEAFNFCIDQLVERVVRHDPDAIVGIESRGFIFGAVVATRLGLPFQLARKANKLPYRTVKVSYELEYGSDSVEMHVDAVEAGKRYAIVDDLIATGGTAAATAELIELQKGKVACFACVIELAFLAGRERLGERVIETLIDY